MTFITWSSAALHSRYSLRSSVPATFDQQCKQLYRFVRLTTWEQGDIDLSLSGWRAFVTLWPLALWPCPYDPMAPYSCFKNSEKWRCSVFVNLYVLRALFCQPVFSIFEFYAGNYAFAFAFEY